MTFFQKIIAFFMAIIAFFAGLFSGGKQPSDPTPEPSNPTAYTCYDCAYGSESRQILDLALPENASGKKGLILFIHGGAWIAGSKNEYRDALKYVSSLGYAAAALNYRYVSDSVHMDKLMEDVASALAKIRALALEKNVQLDRVLLTGVSAGAHMSLLYAYHYADASPIKPVAVVSNCGPTDLCDPAFLEQNELGNQKAMIDLMNKVTGISISETDYKNHSGQYDAWLSALRAYSPLSYVTPQTVPTVLGHGQKDTIVPYANATALDAALTEKGVRHDFVIFPNSGHALDKDADASARMNELLVQYVQAYLY